MEQSPQFIWSVVVCRKDFLLKRKKVWMICKKKNKKKRKLLMRIAELQMRLLNYEDYSYKVIDVSSLLVITRILEGYFLFIKIEICIKVVQIKIESRMDVVVSSPSRLRNSWQCV